MPYTLRLTVILTILLAFPAVGAADRLAATRGEPLREVAHSVSVDVDDGVATYVVRRTFLNQGDRAEQVYLEIELPHGAAATGLRIRAGGEWYDGELMEANRARELYRELTGIGPHAPKDPALLEWQWENRLALHLFPVFAGKTSTVEYTLTAPTRYRDGTYILSYPNPSADGDFATPILQVNPSTPGAAIRVSGERAAARVPIALDQNGDDACERYVDDERASCAVATMEVPDDMGGEASLETAFHIRHTYRSDLLVQLVGPDGTTWRLHDRKGDDGNNLKELREFDERPSATQGTWRLVVSDHVQFDTGSLESWTLSFRDDDGESTYTADGLPLFVADAKSAATGSNMARIEVDTKVDNSMEARLGRVVASADHQFSRLEIDVAEQLSALPDAPQFVFVVDASRSLGEDAIRNQLDLIEGMLHHVPEGRFDVVAYRRFPSRVFGEFVPAKSADEALDRALKNGAFKRGNGSHLDRALTVASQLAEDRKSPTFVVASTDTLLRSALDVTALHRATKPLPDATTVHVVDPRSSSSSTPDLKRNDEHRLSSLALEHGGIMVELDGFSGAKASALRRASLGLVRPTSIDNVEIRGLELDEPIDTFDEGDTLRTMLQSGDAPRAVTITGDVWADRFHRRVRADRRFSRATAGFVFSLSRYAGLSRQEQLRVARFGRAVSPVTSYLAIEPGVRPARIGISRETDLGGAGSAGAGGFSLGSNATKLDVGDYLSSSVRRCLSDHPTSTEWRATLQVETTWSEIVDVALAQPAHKDPALKRCIVEGIWSTTLPDGYRYDQRADWSVPLEVASQD